MPVSMIVVASRPPDWTREQFTKWWRGEHASFAKKLPGLLAYRHGEVVRNFDKAGEDAWDGHAVLTFAGQVELDAALASPEWAAATSNTGRMKGRRIILLTEEVDLLAQGMPGS